MVEKPEFVPEFQNLSGVGINVYDIAACSAESPSPDKTETRRKVLERL
jgi:hypothetical protein